MAAEVAAEAEAVVAQVEVEVEAEVGRAELLPHTASDAVSTQRCRHGRS